MRMMSRLSLLAVFGLAMALVGCDSGTIESGTPKDAKEQAKAADDQFKSMMQGMDADMKKSTSKKKQ